MHRLLLIKLYFIVFQGQEWFTLILKNRRSLRIILGLLLLIVTHVIRSSAGRLLPLRAILSRFRCFVTILQNRVPLDLLHDVQLGVLLF